MPPFPRAVRVGMAMLTVLLFLAAATDPALSQIGDPTTPRVHAFTNARVVSGPGRVIASGTLVIRDGVIEAVGPNVAPPADARIWPSEGFTIYPGFIDPFVPEPRKDTPPAGGPPAPPADETAGIAHANDKVRPELEAADDLPLDPDFVSGLRNAGFTAGNVTRPAGIFRGASSVMSFGRR